MIFDADKFEWHSERPVTIPAQPGYFSVSFELPDGAELTERTDPATLVRWDTPIIAWVCRTTIKRPKRSPDADGDISVVSVQTVTPDGLEENGYILCPNGLWMSPCQQAWRDENGPRRDWLEDEIAKQARRKAAE